jgi:cob(I)alamin adenosyltransferase
MSIFKRKVKELSNFEKITTKHGDDGKTNTYSGERIFKHDLVFEVIGSLDELQSYIGIIKTNPYMAVDKTIYAAMFDELVDIQTTLYRIMSIFATNSNSFLYEELELITEQDVDTIERYERKYVNQVVIVDKFILPGDNNRLSSKFDFARTVTRRSERRITEYINHETTSSRYVNYEDLKMCQKYINRLSDYFFIMARFVEDN